MSGQLCIVQFGIDNVDEQYRLTINHQPVSSLQYIYILAISKIVQTFTYKENYFHIFCKLKNSGRLLLIRIIESELLTRCHCTRIWPRTIRLGYLYKIKSVKDVSTFDNEESAKINRSILRTFFTGDLRRLFRQFVSGDGSIKIRKN